MRCSLNAFMDKDTGIGQRTLCLDKLYPLLGQARDMSRTSEWMRALNDNHLLLLIFDQIINCKSTMFRLSFLILALVMMSALAHQEVCVCATTDPRAEFFRMDSHVR